MAASSSNVMVEDKQRLQALERTLSQIEKSFGKGSIMRLDSDAPPQINGISTGALSLDSPWVVEACLAVAWLRSSGPSRQARRHWR